MGGVALACQELWRYHSDDPGLRGGWRGWKWRSANAECGLRRNRRSGRRIGGDDDHRRREHASISRCSRGSIGDGLRRTTMRSQQAVRGSRSDARRQRSGRG